jgi:4-nitrophenyl phosphatase
MKSLREDLSELRLAIFDLDGVVYRQEKLIANVEKVIEQLKTLGIKVIYNSNNSTITREMYVDKLKKMNINAEFSDFYTSASITSSEITKLKKKAAIFVIGEIGLKEELKAKGHKIITQEENYKDVDFVIAGLDRNFHYQKLAFAQRCILEGRSDFYATNTDSTLPGQTGLLPGAGVMVNAIKTCTDIEPKKIFGKPNPYGIKLILESSGISRKHTIFFGDRLNTDILAGNRAGIKTVLVQTGVSNVDDVKRLEKKVKNGEIIDTNLFPNLIIDSLAEILEVN